nr:hypothetical protein Iba_chr10aCG15050 [Ipomoea batatas]
MVAVRAVTLVGRVESGCAQPGRANLGRNLDSCGGNGGKRRQRLLTLLLRRALLRRAPFRTVASSSVAGAGSGGNALGKRRRRKKSYAKPLLTSSSGFLCHTKQFATAAAEELVNYDAHVLVAVPNETIFYYKPELKLVVQNSSPIRKSQPKDLSFLQETPIHMEREFGAFISGGKHNVSHRSKGVKE